MGNLTKYNPYNSPSLFSHRDEFVTSFDRLFNDIFTQVFPESTKELGIDLFSKGAYPKVNVIDEESKVTIEAEVPGLTKDQLVVDINNKENVLTIKGNKRVDNAGDKQGTYVYRELKQSSFARSFQLNDNLDTDNIKAKFENGMLTLTLPKKVPDPKAPPIKTIQIE